MEELTSKMLLFADKYEICFLYKLCQDHLCTAITKENVFDVIRTANYTNDEKLNRKCSEFMQANLGAFDIGGDPEWTLYKTPTATIPKATASGLGINYWLFFTITINIVIWGMHLFIGLYMAFFLILPVWPDLCFNTKWVFFNLSMVCKILAWCFH